MSAWAVTDSVTLGVFWAVLAGYLVAAALTVKVRGETLRRTSVAVVTCLAALGALTLTVSVWGRAWYAVALSLFVGSVVHWAAAWLVAPSLVDEERERQLRDHGLR